jgi:hypothetical protein
MRNIDKFILHVVHNWPGLINEAYPESTIQKFVKKFSEEAEDFNIKITDDELRKYILRFDDIKNSPKIKEKDLNKYTVNALIRLARSSQFAGDEKDEEEEEDKTPDVVYQDNGITIWNGAKQDNCVTYGAGERWCITRPGGSNWGGYRYGTGEPTFYLAKNTNLSDSNKLSFVALQILNNGQYKFTNRTNSPGMEGPFSWNELLQEVPWLADIPNIKNILKYIPLSNQEKITNVYKNRKIPYKEWAQFPFSAKKQYIIARSGRGLFDDINDNTFVEKHLSKYPQIATVLAELPGIVNSMLLLSNLDKFSEGDRKSITRNIRGKVDIEYLGDISIPFDVKKLLVRLNKWDLKSNERLYVTKDGSTIVKLTLGDNIKIDLFTEEDEYPNIKLNKRTSKYLLDYPELDKIPLKDLVKLSEDGTIDKNVVTNVLNRAKNDPNSALIIKQTEDGEIILDSNTFSSYQIDGDSIKSIPFDNEAVQQVFADSKDNESFQQNALNIFRANDDIPPTIDKNALISVVKSIPYNQRTIQYNETPSIILTADGGEAPFFIVSTTLNPREHRPLVRYGNGTDWRDRSTYSNFTAEQLQSYFAYLRATNQAYNTEGLKLMLGQGGYTMGEDAKKAFIANNPPITDDSTLRPAVGQNGVHYLVNTANPRESFKVSENSGKLIKANIPPSLARQLVGGDQAAAVAAPAAAGRRGRPAGVPNAPRAVAPAPAAGGGGVNVPERMQAAGLETAFMRLPRIDYRKLNINNAAGVLPTTDRGASRRNNQLGNRGRVTQVISIPGGSKIYLIQLANNQTVASINIQPGNRNYLLTGNANGNVMIPLNSPAELLQALQNRGLAEVRRYLTQEYLDRNPQDLDEVRGMLQQYVAEIKNN